MVGQGMMHRFHDLRTQSKLLVSFGLVSVIIMVMATAGIATLRQLSSQSQTVYLEYTVPLAQFSDLGTALTRRRVQVLVASPTPDQSYTSQSVPEYSSPMV